MLNSSTLSGLAYLPPLILILFVYWRRRTANNSHCRAVLQEATEAGLTEPASIHPSVDHSLCLGCGSCANACPAGEILGVIDGRSVLINPADCIGHGSCKAACPQDAITLVFGTERRGVDIPLVGENFETNVPGIFLAGELGGMGLIRNAIEQGRQAMESIRKLDGIGKGQDLDVVIVGAGPAGFSASLAALQHGLKYVTVEQDSLGGTVSHYPRKKLVMTAPAQLPIFGKVKMTRTTKEELLEFWQKVEKDTGVTINYNERMETIIKQQGGFEVKTSLSSYRTRAVLLAIGRRGTPRKLGVPGEELAKVVYRLIDPAQYQNQHVLVVGGGDSALEAATSIAEEPGTTVTLSYRSAAFSRAKKKNRLKVEHAESSGCLKVLLKSNPKLITPTHVVIEHDGSSLEIPNDAVIVCAGGVLPTPFLKELGIQIETKHGTP